MKSKAVNSHFQLEFKNLSYVSRLSEIIESSKTNIKLAIRYARLLNILCKHTPISHRDSNGWKKTITPFLFFVLHNEQFCSAVRLPPLFCIVRARRANIFIFILLRIKWAASRIDIWQNNSPLNEFICVEKKHHGQNIQTQIASTQRHNMNEIATREFWLFV